MGQNIFFFKVHFVGTLNLCLKMPDTEQKTITQSDHPGLRKRQKLQKFVRNQKLVFLISFLMFSQPRMVGLNSRILLCVRHLETTHTGHFEEKNISTYKGGLAIFGGQIANQNGQKLPL